MTLGDSLTSGTADTAGYRRHLAARLAGGGHKFSLVGTVKPTSGAEWSDPRNEGHEGHRNWKLTDFVGETTPGEGAEKAEGTLPAWLQATNPDTVVLLAGSSDELDKTEAEYMRRYGTILAQLGAYRKDVRVVLGLLPSPDIGNLPASAARAWELKRSGAQKAADAAKAQGMTIVVADTNAKFLYRMDLLDRVHPTSRGNEKISDALYDGLVALPAKQSHPR